MNHRIEASDGVHLAADVHVANGNTQGAIVLVHGFAGNMHEGGLFDQLAGRAAEHGFNTLAYNWRGIAPSEGKYESTTMPRHVHDLETVTRWMQEHFPDMSRGISGVGFSLGAAAVGLLARQNPNIFNKIVLLSPAMRPNQSMWPRYNTPEIWDQIRERGFATKPGSNVLLGRSALEMLRDTDLGDNAFEIEQPLLVCHGTSDERIPCSNSRELVAQLQPGRDVTYIEIDGASHSFKPVEHRQRLSEDVIDWLVD